MSSHINTLDLVRQANPIPDPVATAEQLSVHDTLLATIDRRSAVGADALETRGLDHAGARTQRRKAAFAFGVALATLLVAVGIAAMFLRGGGPDAADEPVVTSTSTVPPTTAPAPSTTLLEQTTVAAEEPVNVGMWTRTPDDPAVFGPPEGRDAEVVMMSVAVGGPGFVSLGVTDLGSGGGQIPTVWLSPDGVYWERLAQPELLGTSQYLGQHDLVSTDGGLLATVAEGRPGETVTWKCETEAGPQTCSWAPYDVVIWTSDDGRTWSRVPQDEVFEFASMSKVVEFEGALVALGRAQRLRPTIDGGLSCDGDAYDPSVEGASCPDVTAVWLSVDGVRWTRHEPEIDGTVSDLASTPAGIIAVGNTGRICSGDVCTSMAKIWISRDGLEWNEVIDPSGVFVPSQDEQYVRLSRVAATSSGDTVVAIGGAELRPAPDPEPTDCDTTPPVPTCQRRWVPRTWASADGGATWKPVEPPLEGWAMATSDDDHILLISENRLAVTRNGTDWALVDTSAFNETDYMEDLVFAEDTLVAVGTANGWSATAWTASWSDLIAGD